MDITKAIVAILFYQAEPQSIKRLATLLKRTEGEVREALDTLPALLQGVGLVLVQNGDDVGLATAGEASALIEAITKEELSRDLSKAAQETLAIILYKGPITRSEIDYIRGVNSTFILRNLLVRGLVEKIENKDDQRSFLYKPTFQLLEYMGVSSLDELPDYHDTIAQLGAFVSSKQSEENPVSSVKEADLQPDDSATDPDELSLAGLVAEEMEHGNLVSEIEADLSELDETGEAFRDESLIAHAEDDRLREENARTTEP